MKICLSALLMLSFLSGFSQTTTPPDLSPGYYVVVASFVTGEELYALAYADKINKEGQHSAVGFDPGRKFYHVYLDKYTDFNESIHQMLGARNKGFSTAWVRIMKGAPGPETSAAVAASTAPPATGTVAVTSTATPPPTKRAPETMPARETPGTATTPVAKTSPQIMPTAPAPSPSPATSAPAVPEVTNNDAFIHPPMLQKRTVLMTMFNPTNRQPVEGTIEIVDAERSKLLAKAKGNDSVILPDPGSKSEKLTLIGSSFGYRPVQHELNYMSTEKDSVPDFIDVVDNQYRINFGMDKLRTGDITVLYNVYFYNDAAVMLPDSKYELNKLLALMNDNTGYRIKLHGHTNGTASGKIIGMGKSKDFFTLTSDAVTSFGSAKELSRQRAEIIKDWLVANGIAESRIEVQAHGGSRMIHDKNGPNAKRNVRVEVEIL